ncbi:hypothetical protein THAOC_05600, partial [Thalassiosira oceanica]
SKQPRADAPFGRADDDNGPGSEPPPQDRIGLFIAVMPSPRRPPAAVGKPSFPYFKAATIYLMMCAGRGDQRSFDIESPRLDGVRKIRRHGHKPPESGGLCPPTRVDEDGFLRYRLAVGTILAVKVIIPQYASKQYTERRTLGEYIDEEDPAIWADGIGDKATIEAGDAS